MIRPRGAFLMITENVWPGIQPGRRAGEITAAPTGIPWLDSNGWFLQFARARSGGKGIWLLFDPPGRGIIIRAESYITALLDTAVYGGRWVLSLDHEFRSGLAKESPQSLESFRKIARTLAFFEEHHEWSTFRQSGSGRCTFGFFRTQSEPELGDSELARTAGASLSHH